MSLYPMDMPTSLDHLRKQDMPKEQEINSDTYSIQQRMIDDWIASTPCKCCSRD